MCATIVSDKNLHYPVLLDEVLSIISPQNGGTFIDCTFGQGGYTKKILEFPKTKVIAFDRDSMSKNIAKKLKKKFNNRFEFHNKKFSEIDSIKLPKKISGIIFDLGFSYTQIKDKKKGLSFDHVGKLNMKMGYNKISADDIVKKLPVNDLEQIFKYFGDEKKAKLIARNIVKERSVNNINTEDLVRIINLSKKNFTRKNKATKIFQALRILVNEEISELISALSKSCNLVSDKGIIVTVTFHSVEDKICKFFFNTISTYKAISRYIPINQNEELVFNLINKKVVKPSNKEIEINPPSRSAKLRAIKRNGSKIIDTKFLYKNFKYLLDIEKLSLKL
tara:strand:- start:836 stop:1840 length:1005 start_codon:yes stop_codon:yes gene_type:complete